MINIYSIKDKSNFKGKSVTIFGGGDSALDWALELSNISNTHQLGLVMYTDYILYFQLAGIILLLSMIGAILLTFRQRKGVKKQSYFNQISRNPSSSIELRDVESNKGVKIDD